MGSRLVHSLIEDALMMAIQRYKTTEGIIIIRIVARNIAAIVTRGYWETMSLSAL